MGSISGALTSHLQLNHCHFSARTSQLASARISPTSRRSKLRFSGLLSRRNFNRFVCSAVDDDVIEKQTELGGGNGSTIVEDGPGITKTYVWFQVIFLVKIVIGYGLRVQRI